MSLDRVSLGVSLFAAREARASAASPSERRGRRGPRQRWPAGFRRLIAAALSSTTPRRRGWRNSTVHAPYVRLWRRRTYGWVEARAEGRRVAGGSRGGRCGVGGLTIACGGHAAFWPHRIRQLPRSSDLRAERSERSERPPATRRPSARASTRAAYAVGAGPAHGGWHVRRAGSVNATRPVWGHTAAAAMMWSNSLPRSAGNGCGLAARISRTFCCALSVVLSAPAFFQPS